MAKTDETKQKTRVTQFIDGSSLFWGLSLIFLGVLFLLGNLGVVELYLGNIWQLWPLVIIGFGLSFFELRGVVGVVVRTIAILASLTLILFTVTNEQGLRFNGDATEERTTTLQVPRDDQDIEALDIRVDTGALSVRVDAEKDASLLANASLIGGRKLTKETKQEGTTHHTTFTTSGGPSQWGPRLENQLNLHLTRELPVKLTFDMGASSIKGDLSDIRLRDLVLDTGASSIDLKLGDREELVNVLVDSGASSIRLHIPKHVAYQVNHDGGLSSSRFEGTSETSKNVHQTDDFDAAERKIIIRADTGVSSFRITQY